MQIGRRMFLSMAAGLLAMPSWSAAAPAYEEIDLWPTPPQPDSDPHPPEDVNRYGAIAHVLRPRLRLYRPERPNGTATIVVAGGGYRRIQAGLESTPACTWLIQQGITAYELIYRLPHDGFGVTAPFEDGQRAMRLVRSRASMDDIDSTKIGIMGFSAGGHLAGMTAVSPDAPLHQVTDAIDAIAARPNFAALLYPVLTFLPPYDNTLSRREIVGRHPSPAESGRYSVPGLVDAHSPPMFLAQAENDPISPVENSMLMFQALHAAGVEAELHIFKTGGHGWGLGKPGTETAAWPSLFVTWAQKSGFLS